MKENLAKNQLIGMSQMNSVAASNSNLQQLQNHTYNERYRISFEKRNKRLCEAGIIPVGLLFVIIPLFRL